MLSRGTFGTCHELPRNMPRFQLGWGQRWGGTYDIIYSNPLILGSIGAVAQLVERFAGSEKVRVRFSSAPPKIIKW